ncbi:MAG: tetratricopeptide repeat protein, partial [Planctomycetota bacterium]
MTHRALLLPLVLALPLRAEEPASPAVQVIDVDALEAEWKEFATRFEQVRKGALPLEEFRQHYQQRALAKGTKRQQAIAAYFYGFVLSNVVPQVQGKENKEAKRELQRAIDLEPGLLDAYSELALVAARAGDRTEAERFLTSALQVDRGYVRAVVLLAEMAMRARELERAKALFVQSLEIKPMLEAFGGLVNVNTQLFLKSFDEKDKERFAQEALLAADAIVTLEPDNTTLRLAKAKVFLDLGRVKEAIDYLEGLVASGTLKPEAEADALRFLRGIYQREGSVAGVRSTLERLLKNSTLKPEDRARITSRLKDLNEMKGHAFVRWAIEEAIQVVHNPGVSVEDRLSVLLRLQEFVDPESEALDVKELQPLVLQA